MTPGSLMVGAVPIRNAISDVMMIALASYDTASVSQTTTANARIASIRCPAGGSVAGSGNSSTTIRAVTLAIRPIGTPCLSGVEPLEPALGRASGFDALML